MDLRNTVRFGLTIAEHLSKQKFIPITSDLRRGLPGQGSWHLASSVFPAFPPRRVGPRAARPARVQQAGGGCAAALIRSTKDYSAAQPLGLDVIAIAKRTR
jgi:hypothetical protein